MNLPALYYVVVNDGFASLVVHVDRSCSHINRPGQTVLRCPHLPPAWRFCAHCSRDDHVHHFNPYTFICSCGATASGNTIDWDALARLADAAAEVAG